MNYRYIATEVGDALKYETSINAIDRLARSLFPFQREDFPNDAITSSRAHLIYDWILTLAKQAMDEPTRDQLMLQFCRGLASEQSLRTINLILQNAGAPTRILHRDSVDALISRDLHPEVLRHARDLFAQGNYFHAVFEASKAYNKAVKEKAQSDLDGQPLMLRVWGCQSGVLRITPVRRTPIGTSRTGSSFCQLD